MTRTFILSIAMATVVAGCAPTPQTGQTRLTRETPHLTRAAPITHCVRDTGTRIKPTDGTAECMRPGRTYTQDELDQTGAPDAAEALRRLDPRL
jgi:hypothetical protein